jgi:hypothetical protein
MPTVAEKFQPLNPSSRVLGIYELRQKFVLGDDLPLPPKSAVPAFGEIRLLTAVLEDAVAIATGVGGKTLASVVSGSSEATLGDSPSTIAAGGAASIPSVLGWRSWRGGERQ